MRTKSLSLVALGVSAAVLTFGTCVRPTVVPGEAGAQTSLPQPATNTDWKRFNINEDPALSLMLPTSPVRITLVSESQATVRQYVSESEAGVFGALYVSDLTAAASIWTSTGAEFISEIFIKPFTLNFNKSGKKINPELRLTNQRETKVDGIEGIEQDFILRSHAGQVRIVRVGEVGIGMVAIPTQTSRGNEQKAFFNSVRFGNL